MFTSRVDLWASAIAGALVTVAFSSTSPWIIAISLCLGLGLLICAWLNAGRRASVGSELKLRWKTSISRPWPLDAADHYILSASSRMYAKNEGKEADLEEKRERKSQQPPSCLSPHFFSLQGKKVDSKEGKQEGMEMPRDVYRKSISLWDPVSGRLVHRLQTGNHLSAARGSFSLSSNHDKYGTQVLLGTEVWDVDRKAGANKLSTLLEIPRTDLKSRLVLKNENGEKRVLAVRWCTEWHSLTREYYSRSVTLSKHNGETGQLVSNVFHADWTDSKENDNPASVTVRSEKKFPDFARLECRLAPNCRLIGVHARDRNQGNKMTLHVYDVLSGELVADISPEETEVVEWCNQLVWAPDSNLIATSYVQHGIDVNSSRRIFGFIRVWDVQKNKVWKLQIPGNLRASSMCFSHSGLLAIGDFSGCITLTDVYSGRIIKISKAYSGIVHRLKFSPDGSTLLSTGTGSSSRWNPINRSSELMCWEIPEEFAYAGALKRVQAAVGSRLPHIGIQRLITDYIW
ncbi:hypothetical protein AAMO2058_001051700 [Amorphochlora amoebiformis]